MDEKRLRRQIYHILDTTIDWDIKTVQKYPHSKPTGVHDIRYKWKAVTKIIKLLENEGLLPPPK